MGLPEAFVTSVFQGTEAQCCFALLEPWSVSRQKPASVIAPPSPFADAESHDARRQAIELARAVQNRKKVIVPCTLGTPEQEHGAKLMIPALSHTGACVIAVLIAHPAAEMTKESNKRTLIRCQALMRLGAQDVIVDFGSILTARTLAHKVQVIFAAFSSNASRVQSLLEQEGVRVTEEQFKDLRARYHRALWTEMPRAMMPKLPVLNLHLVETPDRVGKYLQQTVIKDSSKAKVFEAKDEAEGISVVVKTTKKTDFSTATIVESFYRETSFLFDKLAHPHVIKCLEALHGREGIHVVFEHIPGRILTSEVAMQTGQCFPAPTAIECFRQIGSALAHCHEKDICHRSVCLDHILACADGEPSHYRCVLFHFADGVMSGHKWTPAPSSAIGKVPYVPPEVHTRGPYSARCADSWSLGVALLEMAGGLGSMAGATTGQGGEEGGPAPQRAASQPVSRAAAAQEAARATQEAAAKTVQFFQQEGAHAEALALRGGVQDNTIIYYLQKFLQIDPRRRRLIEDEISPNGLLLATQPTELS